MFDPDMFNPGFFEVTDQSEPQPEPGPMPAVVGGTPVPKASATSLNPE